MSSYLLIETRDPFDRTDVTRDYELAENLAGGRRDVAVFLVQNGVLAARRTSAAHGAIERLAARTTLLADDFSLRERGIRSDELADNVTVTSVDGLVDLLVDHGRKIIWH